ncbi:MAG: ATP-binding protein [Gammaproteobacteria bacterium]|nr:ATP-binding protein [Gammaproteobacteria bacterium]
MNNNDLINRAESLLDRLESLLSPSPRPPEWEHIAFRWQGANGLQGVKHPHLIALDDLLCMDDQKQEIDRNTRQFIQRRPANNVLLWGSRGTGKSSLIKALLHAYADDGLRLIEVEKHDLVQLPEIVELLQDRQERFILFCDDLSFEAEDPSYKSLKAVLDGSIIAPPENVLVYATSNRRHLLPEFMSENREARVVDTEIHLGDGLEEKISLSERFGLWASFYPFSQEQYLQIADHWLHKQGISGTEEEDTRTAALQWALKRGSRSGRVASQFALDWVGQQTII